jgi:hypothetical protein
MERVVYFGILKRAIQEQAHRIKKTLAHEKQGSLTQTNKHKNYFLRLHYKHSIISNKRERYLLDFVTCSKRLMVKSVPLYPAFLVLYVTIKRWKKWALTSHGIGYF